MELTLALSIVLGLLLGLPAAFFLVVVGYVIWFQNKKAPRLRPSGALRAELPLDAEGMRLYITSDTGTGDELQYAVAAQMEKRAQERPPDALLLLGDVFYRRGVKDADDPQWEQKVRTPYGQGALAGVPIYAAFGNHDYFGDLQTELDYGQRWPQWRMPHRFYSVRFGKLLKLICFDSNFTDLWFNRNRGALDFLISELRRKRRRETRWVLVMAHHPLKTASARSGHRYAGGYYGWFIRKFVRGKAHVYVSGHAHHLEHRALEGGPHVFVSGGGGDPPHPIRPDSGARYALSANGFLELTFLPDAVDARFILLDGTMGYRTLLERGDFE